MENLILNLVTILLFLWEFFLKVLFFLGEVFIGAIPSFITADIAYFAVTKCIHVLFVWRFLPRRGSDNYIVYDLFLFKMFLNLFIYIFFIYSLYMDVEIVTIIFRIIFLAFFIDLFMCLLLVHVHYVMIFCSFYILLFGGYSIKYKLVDVSSEPIPFFVYLVCFIRVKIFLAVWFCNIALTAIIQTWQTVVQKPWFTNLGFNLLLTSRVKKLKVFKKQLIKCFTLLTLWYLCIWLNWSHLIEVGNYRFIFQVIIFYEIWNFMYQDSSYLLNKFTDDVTNNSTFVASSLYLDKFKGRSLLIQTLSLDMGSSISSWHLLKESACDYLYSITYLKLFNRKIATESLQESLSNLELVKENDESYHKLETNGSHSAMDHGTQIKVMENKILSLGLLGLLEQTFNHVPRAIEGNQSCSSVTSYPHSSVWLILCARMARIAWTICFKIIGNIVEMNVHHFHTAPLCRRITVRVEVLLIITMRMRK